MHAAQRGQVRRPKHPSASASPRAGRLTAERRGSARTFEHHMLPVTQAATVPSARQGPKAAPSRRDHAHQSDRSRLRRAMHPSASRVEVDSTKPGPQSLRGQVGPVGTLVTVAVHESLPHVGTPRGSQDMTKLVCLLGSDRPPEVETVACRVPEEPGPRRLPVHAHEHASQNEDWVPSASTPPIDCSRVSRDDCF